MYSLMYIYLVLEELKLFPEHLDTSLQILFLNFGEKESLAALKLVNRYRAAGFRADLYPTAAKMQKQMKYANKRNVPVVILLGTQELEAEQYIIKNMSSGEQSVKSMDDPIQLQKWEF